MKRTLLLSALLGMGALVLGAGALTSHAQLPGRGEVAPAVDYAHQIVRLDFQYDREGYVEGIDIWHGDSTTRHLSVLAETPTPGPTPTHTPSRTPAPTLTSSPVQLDTSTPPPTNTPRPTMTATSLPQVETSTPTLTSTSFSYTPTPEDVRTPSPTPRPTATPTMTPTTEPAPCELRVTNGPLNVRAAPWGAIVGQVPTNSYLRVEGSTRDSSGTLWYQVWYSVDYPAAYVHSGYVETIAGTNCGPFLAGFHTLAGEGVGAVLAPGVIGRYKILKCVDNGFGVCFQAKQLDPDLKIVCRSFQFDKPPDWVLTSPQTWWDMIQNSLPFGCDWYEIQNESDPPLALAGRWADFSIAMAQIVERERGAALLAFSSGPGNPDLPYWRAMWKYVDWSTTHGLAPNGLPHGIATHSSAYAPSSITLPAGSWLNNPYIAGREKIVCDMAAANHYGASCAGLLWLNTELGTSDGYAGASDVFSCDQKAAIYKETIRRKQTDGVVDGFLWWNIGKIGFWSDDSPCIVQMVSP